MEQGWEVDVIVQHPRHSFFDWVFGWWGEPHAEHRVMFKKHWEGGEKKGLHWDMPLRQSD